MHISLSTELEVNLRQMISACKGGKDVQIQYHSDSQITLEEEYNSVSSSLTVIQLFNKGKIYYINT